MRILDLRALKGPNQWSIRRHKLVQMRLDLEDLEELPTNKIEGFLDRLQTLFPSMYEHRCSEGVAGGFFIRVKEGTWMGHVLEHVVIELLNLAGMPTGFGQTRSTSQRGVYRMVFRARDEQVARAALAEGHALIMAMINDEPFDVPAAVARVRDKLDDCYLGPSTAAIVAAATDRRIPHIRLNDGNLVQLGHGARQRRIWTAETDLTCAIAESIAGDKDLTKTLLKSCGVPVPEALGAAAGREGVVLAVADQALARGAMRVVAGDAGLVALVPPDITTVLAWVGFKVPVVLWPALPCCSTPSSSGSSRRRRPAPTTPPARPRPGRRW